jgi:hypothetical protein
MAKYVNKANGMLKHKLSAVNSLAAFFNFLCDFYHYFVDKHLK